MGGNATEEMKYECWFAGIRGVGSAAKKKLREKTGSAGDIYRMSGKSLMNTGLLRERECEAIEDDRRNRDPEEEYQRLVAKGARCVTVTDQEYPERLVNITSAPYALYVKGELPSDNLMSVAIVGARDCSPYGETMAAKFAEVLAAANVQIVSGMARGVDSAGQKGALNAGGKSFAVLGCGVDICYPADRSELYAQLQSRGGVISELPLGEKPLPRHFPARNRIISGLADIVLVMEAREKSGSLITADMALEQGRDVYALPGPVTSRLSAGCNMLIRQGAGILLSPGELLEELGIKGEKDGAGSGGRDKILLESDEKLVYSCLDFRPRNLDWLLRETRLSAQQLVDILMSLELKGIVREISKNYYVIAEDSVNGLLSRDSGVARESKDDTEISGEEL